MSDYSELRRLAEAARDNCPIWYAADCFSLRHMDLGDSGFVAEANPRVVLALIDEVESLRKITAELRRWAMCENLHHEKDDQHRHDQPCKVLARIDAAMSKEPKP